MIALVLAAATCMLPSSPVLATATVGEVHASLTPGAVHLGDHVATRCDDRPAAHPVAIAAWRGRLAVGFRDGGAWTWDGETFTAIRGLPGAAVRAIATTGETLWIATADGLWSVAGDGGKPARFAHTTLGKRAITALAADGDALLVGVDPKGLWKIANGAAELVDQRLLVGCFVARRARPSGAACDPAPPDRPLHVTALAVHAGQLVAGTFDDGVWELAGDRWIRVAGGPRFVDALRAEGDELYVASATGLYERTLHGTFARIDLGLPSLHVNDLAIAGDTLWLATSRGLAAWDGRSVRVLDTGSARVVYAVAVASDGAVWAGTIAGAVRFGADGTQRFDRARGTLPIDWVTALIPDDNGAVLAGTYDAGVVRLAADATSTSLAPLDGKLWINPHGLARIGDAIAAATLGDGLRWSRGKTPKLPDDDVTSVVRFGDVLWIGTRGGLAKIDTIDST